MSKSNQHFRQGDAGEVSVGMLLTALIVIVVGLALVPTVVTSKNASITSLGSDSAGGRLAELIPLFFVLIIIAGCVTWIVFK